MARAGVGMERSNCVVSITIGAGEPKECCDIKASRRVPRYSAGSVPLDQFRWISSIGCDVLTPRLHPISSVTIGLELHVLLPIVGHPNLWCFGCPYSQGAILRFITSKATSVTAMNYLSPHITRISPKI
jgi:hypothetical protein